MPKTDEGFFSAKDETRLYWQSTLPDSAPHSYVGIVHGYGDHLGRYKHTIDALVAQGHGVLAFDYRGHGKADGRRGDCSKWTDFLDDLEVFWSRLSALSAGKPTFLLGHSHGALMVTHFVAQKWPGALTGIILSAPFYDFAFEAPRLTVLAARLVKSIAPGFHFSNQLKPEQLSRDEAWQQETAADPLYGHVTTPRWFFDLKAWQQALAGKGAQLKGPLLMLAGEADPIASMPAARAFFDTVASEDKKYTPYPGMRHEVLNELGKERVWADINSWISAHR